MTKNHGTYGPGEAKRRFEAALRGAFSTPPKPMKGIPRSLKIEKYPSTVFVVTLPRTYS